MREAAISNPYAVYCVIVKNIRSSALERNNDGMLVVMTEDGAGQVDAITSS